MELVTLGVAAFVVAFATTMGVVVALGSAGWGAAQLLPAT
jgi:hypothetical protein